MKKEVLCFGVASLFVLISFFPAVSADNDLNNHKANLEIYKVGISGIKEISKAIDYEKAVKLKNLLLLLDEALERGDIETVNNYKKEIEKLGVLDEEDLKVATLTGRFSPESQIGDNISNTLCYFHAVGYGNLYFPIILKIIDFINDAIKNASSPLVAIGIIIALLAIFAPIIIASYLIPFRIAMPIGVVRMEEGKIWSFGLKGFKKIIVEEYNPVSVNVSWFTGITLHLSMSRGDRNESFLFMSGLAAHVEESKT